MLTLDSNLMPGATAAAYIDALTAARTSVPHGWVRQANPHRLVPAFQAAGAAARESLASAGIGDGNLDEDMNAILTRIDNFTANPGHILERRKNALALSSTLTNTLSRHQAAHENLS